ncbi:hypothetical protein AAMO2058_000231200 [Amorphochlora amoebiformis]
MSQGGDINASVDGPTWEAQQGAGGLGVTDTRKSVRPGSDADLAQLAASFKSAGVIPNGGQQTGKNSDEELAAMAAMLRGESPQITPAPVVPKKNSDAELRMLARSIGAAVQTPSQNLNEIAKKLMGPQASTQPQASGAQEGFQTDGKTDLRTKEEEKPTPEEEDISASNEEDMPVADIPRDSKSGGGKSTGINTGESKSGWVQFWDDGSSCPYWYNTDTQETTWEEPDAPYDVDESAAHLLEDITPRESNTQEGFICPKCMVKFETQEVVLSHSKSCHAQGPQVPAPKKPLPPKSMADRFFGYFGGSGSNMTTDVDDMLKEAGAPSAGGSVVNLTEKQLKKLIGLNKRNKVLKQKLLKQTEKYNANIKVLVGRDRKYKILLRKQEETHLKEVHVLREQNARLARGLQQQHEEFKRKNLKILKQNQNVGQQLSESLVKQKEKEKECKAVKQENVKLRQYIQRIHKDVQRYQKEALEQRNIVDALKEASKAAHRKIIELEGEKHLNSPSMSAIETHGEATV